MLRGGNSKLAKTSKGKPSKFSLLSLGTLQFWYGIFWKHYTRFSAKQQNDL